METEARGNEHQDSQQMKAPSESKRARRVQPYSGAERLRLWFSYQRYFLLLLGVPLAVISAVISLWPTAWWAWGPLTLISLPAWRFAFDVYLRFPRKIRATLLADRRIAQGRFDPQMVESFCGDPCFRVVARELLTRARIPKEEQERLIAQYKVQVEQRGHQLVFVDRTNGVLFKVDGSSVTKQMLGPQGGGATQEGVQDVG